MTRCTCARDYETCVVHDWRKEVEVPDRKEGLREREIRKGMHLTSSKKAKQEF